MSAFERARMCLWTLCLLTQSLFLWATQTTSPGSSLIWATATATLVIALVAILVTVFGSCTSIGGALVHALFVGALPGVTLAALFWNDVIVIVTLAAFEGLCAGLVAAWIVFDMVALKPEPASVRFDDVVADAKRNAGVQ